MLNAAMAPTPTITEPIPLPPPPVTPGGTYTIEVRFSAHFTSNTPHLLFEQLVSVGCKIYIRRPGPDGEVEERLAEILSIRDKQSNPYSQRRQTVKKDNEDDAKPEDKWEFFVHWESFNKRLDDWVSGSRLVLTRDLEWPRPKPPPGKKHTGMGHKAPGKAPRSQSLLKKATSNAASIAQVSAPSSVVSSPGPTPLKRKIPHDEEEEEEQPEEEDPDAEGDMDVDAEGEFDETVVDSLTEQHQPTPVFSKEQEIEKLRTSGSMTQSISEIAREESQPSANWETRGRSMVLQPISKGIITPTYPCCTSVNFASHSFRHP